MRRLITAPLEQELQSKLNLSRVIRSESRRSNFAKVRTGIVSRATDRDNTVAAKAGSVERWVVGDIEELRAELECVALFEVEVLKDGEVHLAEMWSGNRRSIATQSC